MSDHDHDDHDHGAAGHEIDKMPSRKLFNLLFGLSALTLVACIGVVQLFYQQVSSITDARNAKVSFKLTEYRTEMEDLRENWGPVWLTDDDGVSVKQRGKGVHEAKRFQMPLAEARKRVLESPDKFLKAAPAYRSWPNPDPKAPKVDPRGRRPQPGARGARPTPGARPMPIKPGARPVPGIKPPAGAAPAGAKPAAPAGAKPGAPAGAKPAAPAEGKAPAKPANDGKAPAKPEGKAPPKPAKPAEGKAP